MALSNLLAELRADPEFMANVMAWRTLPARAARTAPLADSLQPALRALLNARGIPQLYLHQAQAVEQALNGQNIAVVTPTASGKTLCYNLPVLHTLLSDPSARALYLFPTKALAQDQLDELRDWGTGLQQLTPHTQSPLPNTQIATYDGDTPAAQRSTIRKQARLILSNPDMLHMGILPYHGQWVDFFAGLRYVVIDEMHTYRGVFGSQVANVLRRLQRICSLYASQPRFICTSATIANPGQLAERLIEQPVTVINENGAPSGEKHIILYNPPVYDAEHGLRRSSVLEAQALAARCILGGVQTIVFGRSRLTTELLLTYLRQSIQSAEYTRAALDDSARRTPHAVLQNPPSKIRGYRGGYLPSERRAIEAGLRSGEVEGVVATNALELGIDIGQLQAAILCGYPGSIASTWQQMGRAGRTQESAVAILVATGGVLDQYIIHHPEFLMTRSPEHALINPDNLLLLLDQLRCAVFELPFEAEERFGQSPFTGDGLALLIEQGEIQRHGSRYFWIGTGYPAQQVSLRSTGSAAVVIQAHEPEENTKYAIRNTNETSAHIIQNQVIGEIDVASAPLLVHEGAIYIHEGQSYQVEQLDLANNLAQVTPVQVDYYTEVSSETEIAVLAEHESAQRGGGLVVTGELQVSAQVVGYRRVRRFTHEMLGLYPLTYPAQVLETSGYWVSILPETQARLAQTGQWFDSPNDYGPNWQEQRGRVRVRDGYRCSQCGTLESPERQHDVHHLTPFRTYGYMAGVNENYKIANRLENLVLVCRNCHQRLEGMVRVQTGLDGLAYLLYNLAPLHLMCAPQDIGVSVVRDTKYEIRNAALGVRGMEHAVEPDAKIKNQKSKIHYTPTIYLYERIAAGLGFALRLYELHDVLIGAARTVVEACPCPQGCPACVGPVLEDAPVQLPTKRLTLALLHTLMPGDIRPTASGDNAV